MKSFDLLIIFPSFLFFFFFLSSVKNVQLLYDADILEEKTILEWANKVSKKYVSKDLAQEIHDKAAPFLTWLKEAEEEDSDSQEEDDDDLEVIITKKKKKLTFNISLVEKIFLYQLFIDDM